MSIDLHNNHNVYILGAGFSHDAGLPLISDFLLRMRDSHEWLESQGRTTEATSVAKVLKFRMDAASAAYWVKLDLENIEELFSLASASDGGITNDIRIAVAATLDYASQNNENKKSCVISLSQDPKMVKTGNMLSKFMTPQTEAGIPPANFECPMYTWYVARLLGMVKDVRPQGENTFITFNYDTIVEKTLIALNLGVDYGSAMKPHPLSYPGAMRLPVYKLHGSVNWSRGENNEVEVFGDYQELQTRQRVPELIPPTWKKVFENQLEKVWADAIKKLSTATRIIVIGFSMPATDMHFKYLLAAGLRTNLSLRQIVFVNPDKENKLEQRAGELLREAYIDSERIIFHKDVLMNFASNRTRYGTPIGLHGLGRPEHLDLQYTFNWH